MVDFVRVPADAAGKRVTSKLYNDGVNDNYTQVMHIGDRNNPDLHQSVNNRGEAKVVFDGGSPDFEAFGRTSVSEANLMDMFKFYNHELPEKFHYTEIGTSTVTHDTVFRGMKLTTGTASGDTAGMYSHRFFHYRPANTMTLIFTMKAGDSGATNLTRRYGWVEPTDGLYFEMTGTDIFVVNRDGNTVSERKMVRGAWNGDRLDGSLGDNNLSGATLDPAKNGIWWIDFQYLGAGAVRFGTWVGGQKVVCHTVSHYGELDRPYMKNGSMCIGFEQENTGITSVSHEMHIFAAVVMNDGYDEYDRTPYCISEVIDLSSEVFVPILSFRPTELHDGEAHRGRLLPSSISALSDTISIEIRVDINTALTGATFASTAEHIEYDTAATAGVYTELAKFGQMIAAGRSESVNLSESFRIERDGVHRLYNASLSDYITISARLLSPGSSQVALACNVIEIE